MINILNCYRIILSSFVFKSYGKFGELFMNVFVVLILFLVLEKYAFGYIDPGTGTLLFSALLGIIGTLFFLFRALIIKLKNFSFSSAKDKNNALKKSSIVIHSEGKQYFNIFKPIVDELIKKEVYFIYYTSSKDDPIFEMKSDFLHSEFIGEGNKAYAKLNFLEADVCLTTTPNIDVFQFRRSRGVKKYVHIVHSPADIGTYCMYSLDFFDAVFLNGGNQISDIRELENKRGTKAKDIDIIGSTYLDVLNEKKLSINIEDTQNGKPTILLAPSWGENGLLKKFGEKIIDPLVNSSFNVIIRPHPQSMIVEKDMIEKLQNKYKDKNIEWDFDKDNIYSLSRAKALISDFSGIIFDYTFLFERPVLIPEYKFDKRGFEANYLKDEIWTFKVLPKISIALNDDNINNLEHVIEKAINDGALKENIVKIREEAYMYPGQSGTKGALALLNMLPSTDI